MSNETNNPYQAYFNAMMDMQKEMANAYFEAQKTGSWDPNMPPPMGMPPFMMPGQAMHPSFMQQPGMHPNMQHPGMQQSGMQPNMQQPGMQQPGMQQPSMMPPHWQQQAMPANQAQQQVPPNDGAPAEQENNVFMDQAQAMLDGALGEDASTFKEILGSFGMSDKEFWKGAMVGAAAALVLSNDNVRGKLMGLVSGAGDMLKTGGNTVKETSVSTASSIKENVSNIKENVSTSSEIFKDTYAAGKKGYQESVQRHNAEPVIEPMQSEAMQPEAMPSEAMSSEAMPSATIQTKPMQPKQKPTDAKSANDTSAIEEH